MLFVGDVIHGSSRVVPTASSVGTGPEPGTGLIIFTCGVRDPLSRRTDPASDSLLADLSDCVATAGIRAGCAFVEAFNAKRTRD